VEEDKDVVERGAQLVRQHLELDIIPDHGQNVLLQQNQAFARQPDDMVRQVQSGCCLGGILPALFPCLNELGREVDGQPQDPEQDGREQGIVVFDCLGKLPEELLVDLGGSHGDVTPEGGRDVAGCQEETRTEEADHLSVRGKPNPSRTAAT
jgi:hypothetical protein